MTTTTTATPGIPVQRWVVMKIEVIPQTQHIPLTMTPMMKTTSSEQMRMSPHHGTSPPNENTRSSIMSSPMLFTSNSPTTLHFECLVNVSPSMTSRASASTSAWMALLNDSQEKSKLPTSTTRTWRNSSTTCNGTYVQKVSSTHSMKAAAWRSPIPLSMNKGPRSSGPYPANGNDEVNDSGHQQWPSTCESAKKRPCSTCSYSRTTGLPPPRFITLKRGSTSHNPKTLSGGKYSDKTTFCTTRSLILRDTCTQTKDSTLDTWKHPPKKGMNIASRHHFSILSLSLASHHLTAYLTYHLTCAPDLVPHDWGTRDHSHDPVTDYLISTIDSSCDQACDLSCKTM